MKEGYKTVNYIDMVFSGLPEFKEKHKKYGPTLLALRLNSINEQIFIKISRIRTIQDLKTQKVQDPIDVEFSGILNYSIFLKIKIHCELTDQDIDMVYIEKGIELYENAVNELSDLYSKKNHDYGEVWRDMRITSMTDLMLVKSLRFVQIADTPIMDKTSRLNDFNEIASDIANYAVFCKVLIAEGIDPMR